ncbi:glycine cleavage system protein H [Phaeovulum sp.]|uniref:glycine cleavage system protein H n=1 Tax=Phaeovulum sp. TaxID=2934796 RepID=UPI0039E62181
MATVRGCKFPDELYFDVARHVWYQLLADGTLRAGVTPVGVALAREVLIFTPKPVDHSFSTGRAIATIESAKWVGSVKAGFDGKIIGLNAAIMARAGMVNRDCYGEGWMFVLAPQKKDWAATLVTGAAVAQAYEDWMESMGFEGCQG